MSYTCNVYWGTALVGSFSLDVVGPTEFHLGVYAGDTFTRTFEFLDSTGTAIPLTGTWAAEERQDPGATDPLATFAVDLTDAANGKVTVSLDPLTTSTLLPGVWDLQQTGTDGSVSTWLNGTVAVAQDVTR